MRIGIVGAMKLEIELIVGKLNDTVKESISGYDFYVGKLNNNEIIICESGVGKVNAGGAALLLISEFNAELVINTGIAGGIGDVKCRDVIIGNGLAWHDFDIRIFGYPFGQVPNMPKVYLTNPLVIMNTKMILNKLNIDYKEGIIVSGDQFVTNLDKLEYVKDLNPVACEMEGCAIAQVCTKAGVDFLVLRYISDIVGEENQNDNYIKFEEEMATRSAKICISLIEMISD